MHILFIYPDILRYQGWRGVYYHGVGYLSAVLKKAGHTTTLMHVTAPMEKSFFVEKYMAENPDLVAFSSTTNQFLYAREWMKWIKKISKETLIICGGIHTTLNPEESIATDSLDIICRGEGEQPLLELTECIANGKSFDHIQNLWVKKINGEITENPLRPILNDLDKLPFADREIFDFPGLCLSDGGAVFMASRGCPFPCAYCCNHALTKIYQASMKEYVRFRSVDHIIEEIKQTLKKYTFIKNIHFDDDILPLKRDWFREFTHKYAEQIKVPFSCNLRANLTNEEEGRQLKDAGCYRVQLGIESGNERIMNDVLKRGLSREQIIRAFNLCKKAGLYTKAYNMIGLPQENMDCVLDTIELNAKCKPDVVQLSIFYPYRGTSLYDLCKEKGLLTQSEASDYLVESVLNLEDLTQDELRFTDQFFNYLVWTFQFIQKTPSPISNFLRTIFRSFIKNNMVQKCIMTTYSFFLPMLRRLFSNS